jgi:hypothetical protein
LRGIVEGSNPPLEGVDNPQTGTDESVPCPSQLVGASRKHSGNCGFTGVEEKPTQQLIESLAQIDF